MSKFHEESAELDTKTGRLYGTLTVPDSVQNPPLVLIVAGSGPTDRDGNSAVNGRAVLQSDCLKQLAHQLAVNGIASVRYDKRGVGESKEALPKDGGILFEHFVNDAADWCRKYSNDSEFQSLFIAGHSEGSLIGILAAQQASNVSGFISLAGSGRPITEVLAEQLFKATKNPELIKKTSKILEKLESGQKTEDVPQELMLVFHPKNQNYLISWARYKPLEEIKKLKIPCLVIQGTTDCQVSVRDADFLADAASQSTLSILNGVNHVFKQAAGDAVAQRQVYLDPSLPIDKNLVASMRRFIFSAGSGAKKPAPKIKPN